MSTHDELLWYGKEIDRERKTRDHYWEGYARAQRELNELERERGLLFDKLMREADERSRALKGPIDEKTGRP